MKTSRFNKTSWIKQKDFIHSNKKHTQCCVCVCVFYLQLEQFLLDNVWSDFLVSEQNQFRWHWSNDQKTSLLDSVNSGTTLSGCSILQKLFSSSVFMWLWSTFISLMKTSWVGDEDLWWFFLCLISCVSLWVFVNPFVCVVNSGSSLFLEIIISVGRSGKINIITIIKNKQR